MERSNAVTLALLAVLVSLGACGTSPPSRYYALESAGFDATGDGPDSLILGVGPIRVPEYLERPQIVTRRENRELHIDDFNRWAEPVGRAQLTVLASNLDGLLDNVIVLAYPYGRIADYDYRLVARVERFDMDASGSTVLEVQWSISDADGDPAVAPRRSRFVTDGGDPDDPGSVAAGMSRCLADFSRDVAAAISAMLDKHSASKEDSGSPSGR